ncbi:mitochondrial import inner membrane translocase subunit TIM14 [Bombus vosnesenskii]|uniref:Mitochondrial import inner membrane translocase subunit TIM14 n=1 Tax=Bombus vosnesenskii TaxID=207650 RepID=A0A6J3KUV7_9HYME|nr:mitochondrial import inner membrane translocase subunit TIM14 [Bombus vosnesenskii]XP_033356867.1 mitochondrial import inner membrane translocase subunit TIM14 [Bombus vosnesenskii]XP_050487757.1 mitochondrial import inner membrane translocase subunit TIM14 [Bombus huntii]XP_050487758.1 mitochondrial import inner membrane translocase subunit TIM14 [Bombus huntii]
MIEDLLFLLYCFDNFNKMTSTLIAAGIGLAVVGFTGRYILKRMPQLSQKMAEAYKNVPKLNSQTLANSKYYKGGFESKMTRREASLILDVSPTASKLKVKQQFKKIMSVNHPDRGGSPYIAAKINEAKDLLEK